MSGPWDRPSSDDADARWPSEDLGQSSDSGQTRDPGSEGAPGWDDWPPAPPAPDDYLIEEPLPPSSDPWAEAWTAEEADAMLGAAADTPVAEPRGGRDAPAPAPEPEWRPAAQEPEPEPEAEPELEPEPLQPVAGERAPRVEPWSPDLDPWRFEPEPEPAAAEVLAEPEPEPAAAEPPSEPATVETEREPEPREPPDLAVPPLPRWPSRTDELPDWLAEPVPTMPEPTAIEEAAQPAAEAEPVPTMPEPTAIEEAAQPAAEAEPSEPEPSEPEPIGPEPIGLEPPIAAIEPEPASALEQAVERPGPESPAAAREASPFWKSILPWRGGASRDAGDEVETPTPQPEPEPAPEPGPASAEPAPAPEPEPETASATWERTLAEPPPAVEPPWPASVPDPFSEPVTWGEAADEPPGFVPIAGGFTVREPADAEPHADAAAPEADAGPAAEAPPAAPDVEPEPAAAPFGEEPGAAEWPDRGESTRVFPTDWTPPQPEPRPSGALEPVAGTIRTRLAQPDADEELDEEVAVPTIAEQAVPWLIGVILLLAGMVIVLLALIFAGDGSLGGSGASPSPLAAVVPGAGASDTPAPTTALAASTSPSATPEAAPTPTPTAEPVPEYGPLEMVYQGRSAALAPIYLLRTDFTVEEQVREPTVLAQDAEFDVRRFAWAPDGRVGAGLLADVLVSVEPGEEKRRLGDGLSTITFGDDESTVYAVRITENGADDSAAVLAIDFASGEVEELATVSYARPQLGDEAALAEARFSDDGGAVRLYWMSDDVLRLWVLGAGAWTIGPADGEVTELDGEPLPTLVSPNGRERIAVEDEDGVTTLTRLDMNDRERAETTVEGMVSHLRWSPAGDRVVFTLGRSASGGGVLQDLFLWDLVDGEAPVQLTTTGAAFGVEWLGTQPRWRR